MKKKKQDISKTICIISTSRADFGLLLPLAEEMVLQKNLKLNFITIDNSGSDNSISSKIKIETLRTRESLRFTKSSNIKFIGSLLTNLNKKFDKIRPDIVFILGDRFEVLSIAQLCCLRKIPIAHISGGEITEGSLDDSFRHAITKLSSIHFVARDEYKKRLLQLGESSKLVFMVGALSASNLKRINYVGRLELFRLLGLPENFVKYAVVTFHSETVNSDAENQINTLLKVCEIRSDIFYLFTSSNRDEGGEIINKRIKHFVKNDGKHNSKYIENLGTEKYFNVLNNFDFMIGNSSSGFTEAPLFNLPVIDIGSRQKNRIAPANYYHVDMNLNEILDTITSMKRSKKKSNTFIDPAKNIASIISGVNLDLLLPKVFFDI